MFPVKDLVILKPRPVEWPFCLDKYMCIQFAVKTFAVLGSSRNHIMTLWVWRFNFIPLFAVAFFHLGVRSHFSDLRKLCTPIKQPPIFFLFDFFLCLLTSYIPLSTWLHVVIIEFCKRRLFFLTMKLIFGDTTYWMY